MSEGIHYCGTAKKNHKGFFLAMLEKSMKEWPGGSNLVMKSTTRVPGDRPLMSIRFEYISQKVLGFIATEGSGSTVPDVPYLSHYPDNYSNVFIFPVLHLHLLGRYFSAYNETENHNRMQQYDIALDKYWVTQSGYFRLANTVALVTGITYLMLLLCHGVPDQSKDKKIPMRKYNYRTVYECFNITFLVDSGTLDLSSLPITIDDSPRPSKIFWYNSVPLPSAIYVTSGNSVSAFTTTSGQPQLFEPNSDDHDAHHTIMSDNYFHGRKKREY